MRATILLTIVIVGLSPAAQAQSAAERVRVSVNGATQPTTRTVSQSFSLTKNLEKAPITAGIDLAGSPLFDVGVSVRLIQRLAVGVAVSSLSRTVDGTVNAKIPHPFYFNALRTIDASLSGLKQSEMAVHIAATYFIPISPKLRVSRARCASSSSKRPLATAQTS